MLAVAAACGGERAPATKGAGESASSGSSATPSAARLPAGDSVAQVSLHLLADFDDEGIIERAPPLDSAPGPYRVGSELYADAAGVVAALEPGATITASNGTLTLRGQATTIPVRMHGAAGTVPYAPVRAITRAFGAYLAEHPEGQSATLWPAARLCEYRTRFGRPGARVYDGAQAEGLFDKCGPAPVRKQPT